MVWRARWSPTRFTASPRVSRRSSTSSASATAPKLKGKIVVFALGKSHPIEFPIPEGIQVAVEKQTHVRSPARTRAQVGQVAANMRSLRPPDPYKQKGIRITGERLKKKAGKAGAEGWRRRSSAVSRNYLSEFAWNGRRNSGFGQSSQTYHAICIASAFTHRVRTNVSGTARASASLRVPLARAHLRAGDRRPHGKTLVSASSRRRGNDKESQGWRQHRRGESDRQNHRRTRQGCRSRESRVRPRRVQVSRPRARRSPTRRGKRGYSSKPMSKQESARQFSGSPAARSQSCRIQG